MLLGEKRLSAGVPAGLQAHDLPVSHPMSVGLAQGSGPGPVRNTASGEKSKVEFTKQRLSWWVGLWAR